MKYYLIAGEASGDLHGAGLVSSLVKTDRDAEVRAWGGPLMKAAGAEVVKDYSELAFMGFLEVVKNIRTILRNFSSCKADILQFQPDVLILIDYPGFNLRMAKWASKQGIRVFYYISPQLWAWNSRRVHAIKKYVERMFVILPFEEAFYRQFNYQVDFVGHPLMDVIPVYQASGDLRKDYDLDDRPIIAVLPGSRVQEVSTMLEKMLRLATHFPAYQFVIAGHPSLDKNHYLRLINGISGGQSKLVYNRTYDLLSEAVAALVTSGTATLETAIFEVPQVVCYSGHPLSFWLAKQLVKVEYISLVNLIAEKPLVVELIQEEFNLGRLKEELQRILSGDYRAKQIEGYQALKKTLGSRGASERCAALIQKYLNQVD